MSPPNGSTVHWLRSTPTTSMCPINNNGRLDPLPLMRAMRLPCPGSSSRISLAMPSRSRKPFRYSAAFVVAAEVSIRIRFVSVETSSWCARSKFNCGAALAGQIQVKNAITETKPRLDMARFCSELSPKAIHFDRHLVPLLRSRCCDVDFADARVVLRDPQAAAERAIGVLEVSAIARRWGLGDEFESVAVAGVVKEDFR